MRNFYRTAKRRQTCYSVERCLGRGMSAQGIWTGVQRGIVKIEADSSAVQRSSPGPIISKRRQLREWRGGPVLHTSVDKKAVSGALVGLVRRGCSRRRSG